MTERDRERHAQTDAQPHKPHKHTGHTGHTQDTQAHEPRRERACGREAQVLGEVEAVEDGVVGEEALERVEDVAELIAQLPPKRLVQVLHVALLRRREVAHDAVVMAMVWGRGGARKDRRRRGRGRGREREGKREGERMQRVRNRWHLTTSANRPPSTPRPVTPCQPASAPTHHPFSRPPTHPHSHTKRNNPPAT
eukprot:398653-Rhodomonas_salina.1